MSETPGQAVQESDDEAVLRVLEGSMTLAFAGDHTFVVGNDHEAMVCRAKGGGVIECFPPVDSVALLNAVAEMQEVAK